MGSCRWPISRSLQRLEPAFFPQGALHRASGGQADLEIVEVQRGGLLSEDDIERLADDFGRL
jgi:hypothetical protein